MNVYSNLAHKRRTKRDTTSRKRAEYLASLPKHPVKRALHRMHPRRVLGFMFSKRGVFLGLKVAGVAVLLVVLSAGALFAYYRKDLDQIRPSELAKRVQTTVTRYYDRNDKLLWEDKGEGNYIISVKDEEISDYMKQATIAIEDKDYYKHGGVSVSGLARAAINNSQGDSVQGGSTLTQQLVKQVFFADEAQKRGFDGIPRKIKEIILSIEVERMYDKDKILELYLNESPYGGRRNGVESAARTYFDKSAKKLTLAESAMLASIPNQPGLYNPYNTAGNKALVSRQHEVINKMVEQGFATQKEADAAKKVDLLDKIKPEGDQFKNIQAPHFVQMVRGQLEAKLGKAVVGRGGLTVKTTIDLTIQNKLEDEIDKMFASGQPESSGFVNGASAVEDVRTGEIIALAGSRDFKYPGFGQDNATTSFIQPGSSIKPFVYAKLFEDKGEGEANYGSGSILTDAPTTFDRNYTPQNFDNRFMGNLPIRKSLPFSRNIPAIKAMAVSGVEPTLKTIRQLGNTYYCTQGQEKQTGLSSAIGGCGTKIVDHVNALASLARLGVYKKQSSVLSVKNNSGEELVEKDVEQKRVIGDQSAYITSDILADTNARQGLFGVSITPNLDAAGVKTAIKTGTSDLNLVPKDIWTVGYTPSLSMAVWLGNPDATPLISGRSSIPAQILDPVLAFATERYQAQKKAKPGEWFSQPKGIQNINGEIYPSYYDKKAVSTTAKEVFDRVSKKLATKCTPDAAKIEISVVKMKDPISKKEIIIAPDGYDATAEDTVHKCDDVSPSAAITIEGSQIKIRITKGTFSLDSMDVKVNGKTIASPNLSRGGVETINYKFTKDSTVSVTVRDEGYYSGTASAKYTEPKKKKQEEN